MSNTLATGSAQTPAASTDNGNNSPDPGTDPNTGNDPNAQQPDPGADPNAEPDGQGGDDGADDDAGGGRRSPDQRIREVVAERNATAEWGKHWFDVAQRLMQAQPQGGAPGGAAPSAGAADPAPVTRPAPKLTDFPAGNGQFDAVKWSEEFAKWGDEQLEVRTAQAVEKRLTARDQQTEQQTAAATWNERVADVLKTEPNFVALVSNPALPITQPMTNFIRRSEVGPQLALHLAKNPAECARISLLKPDQIPLALARLEGRIQAAPPVVAGGRPNGGAPPKPQSRAPAPPNPSRGGAPASVNLETCDLETFLEHRLPRKRL